jgi:hypothetical protein
MNARHIALRALPLPCAILASLSLGRRLSALCDVSNTRLSVRQIVPRRCQLRGFAFVIVPPVATVARGAKRSQFDGIYGVE